MTGYLVIQWSSHFNVHWDGLKGLLPHRLLGRLTEVLRRRARGWGVGKRGLRNYCVPKTTLSLARTTVSHMNLSWLHARLPWLL